jgi:hypothetical protein
MCIIEAPVNKLDPTSFTKYRYQRKTHEKANSVLAIHIMHTDVKQG